MTEKKLYQLATKRIKETLNSLEDKDNFLYKELPIIAYIIGKTPRGCIESIPQGPLPACSKEEAIIIVSEFLEQCSPEIAEHFFKDYESQKIIISEDVTEDKVVTDGETGEYKVFIRETGSLNDLIYLVHEYFHTLNLNDLVYRNTFTEAVSISAEPLFLEFLKEKGFSEYDIALISNNRTINYGASASYLRKALPLYLEVAQNGRIKSTTFKKVCHNFYGKTDYLKFLHEEIIKTDEENREENLGSYKHVLGYICGSVFHQTGNQIEDLIEANSDLRDADIEKFNESLGYGIFMTDFSDYVIRELNYFKPKVYTKKQ